MIPGVRRVDGPASPNMKGSLETQEWMLTSSSIKTDFFPVLTCFNSVSN